MPEPTHFEQLLDAVRHGSSSAARELFDKYGELILRIIRRRLHPRMRTQYDSEDFQQSVWASFLALPPERMEFRTPEELAKFLSVMTGNKVTEQYRRKMWTDKHNLARELSLEDVGTHDPAIRRAAHDTPSAHAVAGEAWERMVRGKPESVQLMLELLRAGHTHEEIARQTGLHPKAIQRYVRKIKQSLRR